MEKYTKIYYKYSSFTGRVIMEKKMEVFELDFARDFEEVDFSNTELLASKGSKYRPCEECK